MKTVTRCTFTRNAINCLIADHIKALGEVIVEHRYKDEGDEWIVSHGHGVCEINSIKDGLTINRETTLTPGEVNKLLTEQARSVLKIKQCSSSVEYDHKEKEIVGAVVTINSQEP